MPKVLIVGDSCVDRYSYGTVTRLAPDKPVPILEQTSTQDSPGMAGNLARNLTQLGVNIELLTNDDWQEVIKERFVHSSTNHMFLRRDLGQSQGRLSEIPDLSIFDAVVVSDYDKGFLSESQIEALCGAAKISFLDTKRRLGNWCLNATFVKINEYERDRSSFFLDQHPEISIIETLGSRGAKYRSKVFEIEPLEIIDVSGAGDAFLAAFVAKTLSGASVEESIVFANSSARKVVAARGVTTV